MSIRSPIFHICWDGGGCVVVDVGYDCRGCGFGFHLFGVCQNANSSLMFAVLTPSFCIWTGSCGRVSLYDTFSVRLIHS